MACYLFYALVALIFVLGFSINVGVNNNIYYYNVVVYIRFDPITDLTV